MALDKVVLATLYPFSASTGVKVAVIYDTSYRYEGRPAGDESRNTSALARHRGNGGSP